MKYKLKYILICFIVNLICSNISISNINSRFSIGLGRLGGNNSASLTTSNFMAQFQIIKHHSVAISFYKGEELILIGVEAPTYNEHELKEIEKYQEIGLLYYYNFELTNSPYIGLGVSYFRGIKRNDELIKQISIPFELGLDIKIYRSLSLGIGFWGTLNNYTQIKGVIFRILI